MKDLIDFMLGNKAIGFLVILLTFYPSAVELYNFIESGSSIDWAYIKKHVIIGMSLILFLYFIKFITKWIQAREELIKRTRRRAKAYGIYISVILIFVIFAFYPLMLSIQFLYAPLFNTGAYTQLAIATLFFPVLFLLQFVQFILTKKCQSLYPSSSSLEYKDWSKGIHMVTAPLFSLGLIGGLSFFVCLTFSLSQLTFVVFLISIQLIRIMIMVTWFRFSKINFPI